MHQDTRRHLIALALLALGATSANLLWSRTAPEATYHVAFDQVPLALGTLRGEKVPVEERTFNYLEADAMEERLYRDDERAVRLTFVYGRDWRAVHSPLSCLPQQGWHVDERQLVDLPAPADSPHSGPLHGQLLVAHKARHKLMVLYIFAHQGGTTGDWKAQGWAVARNPRGSGGLMLAASTAVSGDGRDAALGLLKEVCTSVYRPVVGFWYHT